MEWAPGKPHSLLVPHCQLGKCSLQIHRVSSFWDDWIGWSPASLAEKTQKVQYNINPFLYPLFFCNNYIWICSNSPLTFTLAVVVSGTWPVALPYSRFSCMAWGPTRAAKAVARWRRSKVFCGGIFKSSAKVSELKRGSKIYKRTKKTDNKIFSVVCYETVSSHKNN